MFKSRFVKNTSWLLMGSVLKLLFSFAINILWARFLGPAPLGQLQYVATYTAFFTSICTLGINGVIVYELVNHNDDGKILGTAIWIRFVFGVFSSILMVVVVGLFDSENRSLLGIAILQAIQLPFCAFETIKFWFQRNMQSQKEVTVVTITYVLTSIYKMWVLIFEKSLLWFAAGTTIDIVVMGLLQYTMYKKVGGQKLIFSASVMKRILHASFPFLVANLASFVYTKVDVIMLRKMLCSDYLVGLYSVAIAICGYISFVPTAILDSARPLIMEAKNISKSSYERKIKQLILGIMGLALAYSLFITTFGKYVILILYGNDYSAALTCLKIAVWYTAFSYLGGIKSLWLLCENKNNYVLFLVILGALTNILLNFIFIPKHGIEGAAAATLITQILSNFAFPAIFRNTRRFSQLTLQAITLRIRSFPQED